MRIDFATPGMFSLLLSATQLFGGIGNARPTSAPIVQDEDLQTTRDLVRKIQFVLLRLGLDAGPIDGLPRQRTNRAVRP